jgi:hypothetical protein
MAGAIAYIFTATSSSGTMGRGEPQASNLEAISARCTIECAGYEVAAATLDAYAGAMLGLPRAARTSKSASLAHRVFVTRRGPRGARRREEQSRREGRAKSDRAGSPER